MPKRVALTALLPATSAALEPQRDTNTRPADVQVSSTPEFTSEAAPAVRLTEATPPRPRRATPATNTGHQHYSQLTRKEARLRDDQIDELATQARRLSRAKNDSTERITDNTLIRVAVDLLLAQPARLKGSTEAELRKSVGL